MDASLTLEGLIAELDPLLESEDFEGAEALLLTGLGYHPGREYFLHYQLGRVYVRWNKMSSALAHLMTAAELAFVADEDVFLIQIRDEIRHAKKRQAEQAP